MTHSAENDALIAVVRSSGQAMFHTQDCDYAKRSPSALYALPEDFAPTDVWCSRCLPDGPIPPAKTEEKP